MPLKTGMPAAILVKLVTETVERGCLSIADVLRTYRSDSAASLQATLKRFFYLYNHHISQKNLHYTTPLRTLQQWYAQQSQLFKKILAIIRGPTTS